MPMLENLLTEGSYVSVMKMFAMYYCNVIYFSSLFKINPMESVLPSRALERKKNVVVRDLFWAPLLLIILTESCSVL